MDINSHVQIPNGILKYFRDESSTEKKVWYLDINTGEIRSKAAGKLGTIKGWYSTDTEHFLSSNIESPVTQVNAKIRAFCNGEKDVIQLTPDDHQAIWNYIHFSAMRSKIALKSMNQAMTEKSDVSEQTVHDFLMLHTACSQNILEALPDDLHIAILINRTSRNLVVPRCCFYTATSRDCATIIAPISPTGAILILPDNYPGYFDGYSEEITNSDIIQELNLQALKQEFCFDGEFIASNSKLELEYLQTALLNNHSRLESFRNKYNGVR